MLTGTLNHAQSINMVKSVLFSLWNGVYACVQRHEKFLRLIPWMLMKCDIFTYIRCKSVVVKYKRFTVKGLNDIALRVHTSELRDVTWDDTVNCHPTQVNASRLTPARKAGT